MERQIPVEYDENGRPCCDICGRVAACETRETKNREQSYYCDDCARRYTGWPETAKPLGG